MEDEDLPTLPFTALIKAGFPMSKPKIQCKNHIINDSFDRHVKMFAKIVNKDVQQFLKKCNNDIIEYKFNFKEANKLYRLKCLDGRAGAFANIMLKRASPYPKILGRSYTPLRPFRAKIAHNEATETTPATQDSHGQRLTKLQAQHPQVLLEEQQVIPLEGLRWYLYATFFMKKDITAKSQFPISGYQRPPNQVNHEHKNQAQITTAQQTNKYALSQLLLDQQMSHSAVIVPHGSTLKQWQLPCVSADVHVTQQQASSAIQYEDAIARPQRSNQVLVETSMHSAGAIQRNFPDQDISQPSLASAVTVQPQHTNRGILQPQQANAAPAKAKKAAKPKAKPTHPKTTVMIVDAVKGLDSHKGSSLQAIKKHIAANNKVDLVEIAPFIRKGIKSLVEEKVLVQVKGSFKMSKEEKPKKKKVVKKKTAKKVVKKKKTTMKAKTNKKAAKKSTKKAAKPAAKKTAKPAKKAAAKKTPKETSSAMMYDRPHHKASAADNCCKMSSTGIDQQQHHHQVFSQPSVPSVPSAVAFNQQHLYLHVSQPSGASAVVVQPQHAHPGLLQPHRMSPQVVPMPGSRPAPPLYIPDPIHYPILDQANQVRPGNGNQLLEEEKKGAKCTKIIYNDLYKQVQKYAPGV